MYNDGHFVDRTVDTCFHSGLLHLKTIYECVRRSSDEIITDVTVKLMGILFSCVIIMIFQYSGDDTFKMILSGLWCSLERKVI